MKIGDKIKEIAKNPVVQANRQKLKAIGYIAKYNEKGFTAEVEPRTFSTVNPFSGLKTQVQGWLVSLIDPKGDKWGYKLCVESVELLPLNSYDTNGERPKIVDTH